MLDFESVVKEFPRSEQPFKRHILREFLQYQILDIIYRSKQGEKLVFLGGTALRIVHKNNRFSEDIDFDNIGLTQNDFSILSEQIKRELEFEGYRVKIKQVFKGAYHCYIRFPELLYAQNLSPLKQEKILIQLDTEPQNFDYIPDKFLMRKFNFFRHISVVPVDILLSQKIAALLGRKRSKGRDYFDVTVLFSKTDPNFDYLSEKLQLKNIVDLKDRLLINIKKVNLKELAGDVRPFLINQNQIDRILLFKDFVESL